VDPKYSPTRIKLSATSGSAETLLRIVDALAAWPEVDDA
jgi:hypothetical protein